MNVILGALYIRSLITLAKPPDKSADFVKRQNYLLNKTCLKLGLSCLLLKLFFGVVGSEMVAQGFKFGDTVFFWVYMLSSIVDILEHTREFVQTRKKGKLIGATQAFISTVWKLLRTPATLKKLSAFIIKKTVRKTAIIAAYSATLYATVHLMIALAVSIGIVFIAHNVILYRAEKEHEELVEDEEVNQAIHTKEETTS